MLSQFVSGAKIVVARVILGDAKPGVRQPIPVLLNCTGKFCGVAAIRPIGKERELFGLAERTEIRIVLQDFGERAVELGTGDSSEIWQCKIVTADTELPENAADFGTAKRGLAQH